MHLKRKVLSIILAAGMISSTCYAAPALTSAPQSNLQASPPTTASLTIALSQEGQIPLRSSAEALGYTVSWQADTKCIVLEKSGMDKKVLDPAKISGAVILQGHWQVPVSVFERELDLSVVVRYDGKAVIESARYAPEEASTIGEIKEVVQGKDGIQILIKGQKFGSYGYDEISLALKHTTPVTGGKLEDLKAGTQVYATYGKAVTKSLPPMGQGLTVEILKDKNLLMGRVMEIIKGDKAGGAQLRIVGTSDFLVRLSEKTTITDNTGKAVPLDTLKEGMILKATIAPYATMSLPPQTEVYSIIVQ